MIEILRHQSQIILPIRKEITYFPERITIFRQPLLPDICTPAKAPSIQQSGEKIRINVGVCDIALAQLQENEQLLTENLFRCVAVGILINEKSHPNKYKLVLAHFGISPNAAFAQLRERLVQRYRICDIAISAPKDLFKAENPERVNYFYTQLQSLAQCSFEKNYINNRLDLREEEVGGMLIDMTGVTFLRRKSHSTSRKHVEFVPIRQSKWILPKNA